MKTQTQLLTRIKTYIIIIIVGLVISGITAFPLETELEWLNMHSNAFPEVMQHWLSNICNAIKSTNKQYPYLSYGTDWLAFAHLVLAVLFIGPLMDPVKNVWVIQFGMIASVLIFPLAFIAGEVRSIPVFWRFIDCSFGIICLVPLGLCYRNIKALETLQRD